VELAETVSRTPLPTIPTAHKSILGGKAKPLKAPKKEKKDMDEDEIAFREKQKAGTFLIIAVMVVVM